MDTRKISEDFSVAGQIAPMDLSEIAAMGFASVMCNRPDGEATDQPAFAQIAQAANAAGLEAAYVPVQPSGVVDSDIEGFRDAFKHMPPPVLAFCRSGMRSAGLWALNQAQTQPVAEVLAQAAGAGYDLTPMAHRLDQRHQVAENSGSP
ncbi:MAG: TIGR01244 family sulfur transferase [Pseudomonadota bacterium]